jgi:hypothetical protein
MPITWTLPRKSDEAAIARMQKHFPKPKNPMPEAWFMGNLNFFTWLDHDTDEERLYYALGQIGSGLICFPEVRYAPLWKEWFQYLLPHLILRVRASKNPLQRYLCRDHRHILQYLS